MSDTKTEPARLLIRCHSHRARQKVFAAIGERKGLYSLRRNTGPGGVFEVSLDDRVRVSLIKGVTGFRDGPDLMNCWS